MSVSIEKPATSRRRSVSLRALCASLIACALVGCQPGNGATGAAEPRSLSLLVSGDTQGWIMPCGCTSNQSGGLARRASYVERLRRGGDVIVADVGGAPGGTSRYDRVKFVAILAGEVAMGSAAHNLGAAELNFGPDELRRLAHETGAPLLSANAFDKSGARIAPAFRILEESGRRVAIIGVVSQQYATREVSVSEPRQAVLEALGNFEAPADAVVVLAYAPTEELESLAAALPEVDLVIGGPTRQSITPRLVGTRTQLAAVTNKGKFLARFDAPAPGAAQPWQGQIVDINGALADDPKQIANLDRYRKELTRLDLSADETSFAAGFSGPIGGEYRIAGTDSCRQCHQSDCKIWDQSSHAAAWETLKSERWEVDSDCQRCHTTGYGLPGGFVSAQRSVNRIAVGCESCHGPSQVHAQDPTRGATYVARDQCQTCHDRDNSPAFAFEKYWGEISHGAAEDGSKAERLPLQTEASP
ncbi:MAG TPA: multiheme c-type cytochrome [Pirellulales bacterium]|jgi:hypothetical protein